MCVVHRGNWNETIAAIREQQERELRERAMILLNMPFFELPTDIRVLEDMVAEAERRRRQPTCKPNYTWTTIADAIEKRCKYGKIFPF